MKIVVVMMDYLVRGYWAINETYLCHITFFISLEAFIDEKSWAQNIWSWVDARGWRWHHFMTEAPGLAGISVLVSISKAHNIAMKMANIAEVWKSTMPYVERNGHVKLKPFDIITKEVSIAITAWALMARHRSMLHINIKHLPAYRLPRWSHASTIQCASLSWRWTVIKFRELMKCRRLILRDGVLSYVSSFVSAAADTSLCHTATNISIGRDARASALLGMICEVA